MLSRGYYPRKYQRSMFLYINRAGVSKRTTQAVVKMPSQSEMIQTKEKPTKEQGHNHLSAGIKAGGAKCILRGAVYTEKVKQHAISDQKKKIQANESREEVTRGAFLAATAFLSLLVMLLLWLWLQWWQ